MTDPDGVALAARPIPATMVEPLLAEACRRLGVPLPVGHPCPRAQYVPRLRALHPGHEEATYTGAGVILVEAATNALLLHGLGHWLAETVHRIPAGQRSEAWARLAEGRPTARLAAWLRERRGKPRQP